MVYRKKRLEEARRRIAERQAASFEDPELFQQLVEAEFERRRKELSGEILRGYGFKW